MRDKTALCRGTFPSDNLSTNDPRYEDSPTPWPSVFHCRKDALEGDKSKCESLKDGCAYVCRTRGGWQESPDGTFRCDDGYPELVAPQAAGRLPR